MDLGLYTDSLGRLGFEEMLDAAAALGLRRLEISTGGQSSAPHLRIDDLLASAEARRRYLDALERRGLSIAALNCSSWPLDPVKGAADHELIRKTIRLAEHFGVTKIVTMSGCPGDQPNDTFINWVWFPWPEAGVALLERQWEQTIAFWLRLAGFAFDHGVEKIALELHPLNLVYNVPTLLRLREAVGPIVGANLDPSHLFWQQMDPVACIRALGEAVYHVHLKDTQAVPERLALAGVLDNQPFRPPFQRAWTFRTVGYGHDALFWRDFVTALKLVGYDDVLSIENEDAALPGLEGVQAAVHFMRQVLGPG